MKIYVTNLNGQLSSSVAMIAQNNVLNSAQCFNAHEMGIYSYDSSQEPWNQKSARFDGIIAGIKPGDVVIFQSPSWNSIVWDLSFIERLKLYRARIIIFIHDVLPLQFDENYYLMEKFLRLYNMADVLIVPSEKMFKKLKDEGLENENYVVQEMWDIPCDFELNEPEFEKEIRFSGNPSRFPFVNDWNFNTNLHIYTKEKGEYPINVVYEGWKNKDMILYELSKGGFGLVWGNSTKIEDERDYYKLNCSYKLSTYLAAGIPVIIPSYLSNVSFIRDNNLGFVVDSLEEADQMVQNCTEEHYNELVQHVQKVADIIRNGYFTKRVIAEAIVKLIEK